MFSMKEDLVKSQPNRPDKSKTIISKSAITLGALHRRFLFPNNNNIYYNYINMYIILLFQGRNKPPVDRKSRDGRTQQSADRRSRHPDRSFFHTDRGLLYLLDVSFSRTHLAPRAASSRGISRPWPSWTWPCRGCPCSASACSAYCGSCTSSPSSTCE